MEKFVLAQAGEEIGRQISEAGASAKLDLKISDFNCKLDSDLVGVYACDVGIKINMEVRD
ncbi:MAG: hypothetical protein COT74_03975 [Bdellovibrionales bacterium CG10_big_fil_rev_8_21_14_0_10_45_34]|nr:MAG: hypothetical protein COT74_03975 [Bdellovibrionales bacterium CG10_big_fil_rev_8_21_14_0_10_45_34]